MMALFDPAQVSEIRKTFEVEAWFLEVDSAILDASRCDKILSDLLHWAYYDVSADKEFRVGESGIRDYCAAQLRAVQLAYVEDKKNHLTCTLTLPDRVPIWKISLCRAPEATFQASMVLRDGLTPAERADTVRRFAQNLYDGRLILVMNDGQLVQERANKIVEALNSPSA